MDIAQYVRLLTWLRIIEDCMDGGREDGCLMIKATITATTEHPM